MISMAELAPPWFGSEPCVWPNRPPIKTATLATNIVAVTIMSFRMDPSWHGRTRRLAFSSRRRAGRGSKGWEFSKSAARERPRPARRCAPGPPALRGSVTVGQGSDASDGNAFRFVAPRTLISPQVFDLAGPERLDPWVFAGAWSRLIPASA